MTRYMTLFGITPAAWAPLAARAADRGHALGAQLRERGVHLLDLHQAFGGTYDGVAYYDAPSDAVADDAVGVLRTLGPGRGDRTILLQASEHPVDALHRLVAAAAHDGSAAAGGAVVVAAGVADQQPVLSGTLAPGLLVGGRTPNAPSVGRTPASVTADAQKAVVHP